MFTSVATQGSGLETTIMTAVTQLVHQGGWAGGQARGRAGETEARAERLRLGGSGAVLVPATALLVATGSFIALVVTNGCQQF